MRMETLGGFPNLPATLRCRRSRQAPHATDYKFPMMRVPNSEQATSVAPSVRRAKS